MVHFITLNFYIKNWSKVMILCMYVCMYARDIESIKVWMKNYNLQTFFYWTGCIWTVLFLALFSRSLSPFREYSPFRESTPIRTSYDYDSPPVFPSARALTPSRPYYSSYPYRQGNRIRNARACPSRNIIGLTSPIFFCG